MSVVLVCVFCCSSDSDTSVTFRSDDNSKIEEALNLLFKSLSLKLTKELMSSLIETEKTLFCKKCHDILISLLNLQNEIKLLGRKIRIQTATIKDYVVSSADFDFSSIGVTDEQKATFLELRSHIIPKGSFQTKRPRGRPRKNVNSECMLPDFEQVIGTLPDGDCDDPVIVTDVNLVRKSSEPVIKVRRSDRMKNQTKRVEESSDTNISEPSRAVELSSTDTEISVHEKHLKNRKWKDRIRRNCKNKWKWSNFVESSDGKLEFENVEIIAGSDGSYKCSECDYVCKKGKTKYDSKYLIKRHVKARHSGQFKCSICNAECFNQRYLKSHIEVIHEGRMLTCEICQKPFRWKGRMRAHLWTHKSDLEKKSAMESGEKPPFRLKRVYKYKCKYCDMVMTHKARLLQHEGGHSQRVPSDPVAKLNQCPTCGKLYSRPESLEEHILMVHEKHRITKWFSCTHCTARFFRKSQLSLHMRTHTGEKPFVCDICDKRFATSTALKFHKITHTNERPYQCNQCDMTYRRPTNLLRHKAVRHGGNYCTGRKPGYGSKVACKKSNPRIGNVKSAVVVNIHEVDNSTHRHPESSSSAKDTTKQREAGSQSENMTAEAVPSNNSPTPTVPVSETEGEKSIPVTQELPFYFQV